MEFVADLHLHSKYSRAVSQQMILPQMAKWASKKGINILSTGDWTHPLWLREIKSLLEEASEGIYELRIKDEGLRINDVRFILTTEIASIYKQGDKLRRIHNLLFAPSLEIAEKINEALRTRGCNLSSDGRPIIGLSSRDLLELALNIDRRIILIPCHAWTPHFGIYGSASGFDSIEECFGDLARFVYGIETGISSDPWMNWQIPELKNRSILSFSDAHSLPKMAREATVFEIDKKLESLSYMDIGRAIAYQMKKNNGKKVLDNCKVAYTIEFYPEEGKYHFAGHRNCKVSKSPEEINKEGEICPVCKRKFTEGVMYRVEQLSDSSSKVKTKKSKLDEKGVNWIEDPTNIHPPFVKLVPLNEIIAESISSPVGSEKVKIMFDEMCSKFGSEIEVLLRTDIRNLEKVYGEKIAEGVAKVRKEDIFIEPGYDGEYGKVKIWKDEDSPGLEGKQELRREDQLGLGF
ncbi:DNA helicase UvrD [Candidatus Roizmanbacteria bacterium]|nr:DNA helicase UvrD [Candidatus Roizmanbacteria bacterium]